ncbi:PhoH family protein [Coraliomargarita sp. SDUM461003]|uniref:PhoH-like protein n=1 Tax=Thalassobacterium maritimum TaxID=3041265 RepID=A0ABU1AP89_9BACT|nr:PhoH family protein [Coraliomargarita sp. SDUM461003]MBT61638.1 phosphate starvation-inducible protein PhoH [Puniceicoccaceae bacterium]MDQ8205948.1 PhoH family protein [Coraliomargarita sp. SDUM461003]HBR94986.1 phosphate starvation-inducible protein PhoH [Opitutae bacterium]|tara:strand:+ start:3143 stop:4087 length:945 start_codon:yes stop_codon:yes gene_type:complete
MPSKTIHFSSARQLSLLYADDARHLEEAEQNLGVSLVSRDDWVTAEGSEEGIAAVQALFELLGTARDQGLRIRSSDFLYTLRCVAEGRADDLREIYRNPLIIKLKRQSIVPKTLNQKRYLQAIDAHPITFGIGPAGTGKTYLAMAMALRELLEGRAERIILTRPAVEAGEALGFLPGELQEKVLPYLTPLYDAMNDMIGKEQTMQLVERGIVEIAPLAYMRGRTLANAFVVLDEAQNTTHEQMMMFLTRLGDGSRMVITGDITQTDLPRSKQSGLKEATRILKNIEAIRLFYFDGQDVVRHPLVQDIINAYAKG